MSKITGIGGVFFNIDYDTQKLLKWYKDVLELDVSEYGINFLQPNLMSLVTFEKPDGDLAILNFAVDDIEDFMTKIKGKGVEVHKEIETMPFGKFSQIKDIAGNVIELCQLNPDVYRSMVQKEIDEYSNGE